MFKKFVGVVAGMALIAGVTSTANAAPYMPVGPQNDVLKSTVLSGGWSVCFSEPYGTVGTSISSILAGCSGTSLMMAGAAVGSSTFDVLAQALFGDVAFATGDGSSATHVANGTQWYLGANSSWGFAGLTDIVYRVSCDAEDVFNSPPTERDRLCWHTGGGALDGGWRSGDNIWLNGSQDFERFLLVSNNAVGQPELPAPGGLALLGLGLLGLGALRRKLSA